MVSNPFPLRGKDGMGAIKRQRASVEIAPTQDPLTFGSPPLGEEKLNR